jgi:hypothetical protein
MKLISRKSQEIINGNILEFRQAGPQDIYTLAELRWQLCTDDSPNIDYVRKAQFIEHFRLSLPVIESEQGIVHLVAESK